jgi:uncharacterized protein (TIGR01440 family)
MSYAELAAQVAKAAEELIALAQVRAGQVLVVGCSTSEVLGSKIGTAGSEEPALAMFKSLQAVAAKHELFLAIQCCEHLNRALVVERTAQEKYGWTEVTVRPMVHAGGAMGTAAYETFAEPVVVEEVTAHLGLDIGQTLIGMHLKRVAVPVRLSVKQIGSAVLTAARTRPPLIGGNRAHYPEDRP